MFRFFGWLTRMKLVRRGIVFKTGHSEKSDGHYYGVTNGPVLPYNWTFLFDRFKWKRICSYSFMLLKNLSKHEQFSSNGSFNHLKCYLEEVIYLFQIIRTIMKFSLICQKSRRWTQWVARRQIIDSWRIFKVGMSQSQSQDRSTGGAKAYAAQFRVWQDAPVGVTNDFFNFQRLLVTSYYHCQLENNFRMKQ